MLSVHPQTSHETFPSLSSFRHLDLATLSSPDAPFYHVQSGMGGGYPPKSSSPSHQAPAQTAEDVAVAQALEIARESPDGAQDPTVNSILEAALAKIWAKVQARPDSYVMTRDEFAVFNFYQHRFIGNKMAVAARKRYWDNATGSAA